MNRKMFLPIFVLMALVIGACGINVNVNIDRGSGHVITQKRDVSNFDHVLLSGIGDVDLVQGDTENLEIEAEDNVIPHIKTEVSGGTLTISFEDRTIIPTAPIKFHLTMRNIRGLDTKGVSNIKSDKIKTDKLDLGISGTGNIDIRSLDADSVSVNVSGAGNLTTEGKVNTQKVSLSGAGNYDGENLESKSADITITGLGRVTAWVTDTLDVTISGTGGVEYYGSPQVSQRISGLGRISNKGNK